MHPQAFLDDVRHRHARRQRAVRILKHDLHVVAIRPHLLELEALDRIAHEHDRARRRDQPQNGETERRLARAGFADDAERLALAQFNADAVDRLDVPDDLAQHAALDRKPDLQIFRLDDDGRVRARRRRIRLRLGREQRARIGMFGRGEHALHLALLDDLAALHDADPVGELAHDAEVVRDEQHRHAERGLRVLQQLQNLRLHRDVERGGRLVGDQQVGLVGERHRDHHALALAAGQLMRIAAEPSGRIGNADLVEQFDDARARRLACKPLMQQQDFADLLLDRVQRIERRHRLLEDDRDVVAAHVADLFFRHGEQFAALET